MLSRSRTAVRTFAASLAVAAPLGAVALAGPAAADTPSGWEDGTPMSTLDVLLIFVGIPVALALVLTLFGYVLARRTKPSYEQYVAGGPQGPPLEASASRAELAGGH
ncbi:hypothetical protein CLV56_3680 [Mumia flava]|uniref:Secreted protein n=1 Tax=Mumia flava TaxID=1348852 RepID=A0A0B2BQQ8_9ACTN|nr:hypothetical protein [Mumia flava]PJJ54176.1 hypothetical protein CLV56_3680 [Mumia flava]